MLVTLVALLGLLPAYAAEPQSGKQVVVVADKKSDYAIVVADDDAVGAPQHSVLLGHGDAQGKEGFARRGHEIREGHAREWHHVGRKIG